MLKVSVWRGGKDGAFQTFEVPREASQTGIRGCCTGRGSNSPSQYRTSFARPSSSSVKTSDWRRTAPSAVPFRNDRVRSTSAPPSKMMT